MCLFAFLLLSLSTLSTTANCMSCWNCIEVWGREGRGGERWQW